MFTDYQQKIPKCRAPLITEIQNKYKITTYKTIHKKVIANGSRLTTVRDIDLYLAPFPRYSDLLAKNRALYITLMYLR